MPKAARLLALLASIVLLPATLHAAAVTVAWDANVESDVVGYVVFYGTQSGVYTVTQSVGNITSWTVNNLTPGQTYYFAVEAVNSDGLTSPLSQEVSALIPATTSSGNGSSTIGSSGSGVTDGTGPSVTVTSHADGQSVTASSITLSGTASDAGRGDSGVGSVTVNGVQASNATATGSATASWSATVALVPGANTISIVAQDASSSSNVTTVTLTINYSAPPPVKLTGLSASVATFQSSVPVTWTATATGGTAPIQYRFWLYDQAANQWTILQDYEPSDHVTWTPTADGTYQLQVWIRSAGSTATYEDWASSGYFAVATSCPRIATFTADQTFPVAPGTVTRLTATASGGTSPLQYKFYLYSESTATWSVLQDYNPTNSVVWTPTTPGRFRLQVWVRSAGSGAAYEDWKAMVGLDVQDAVSITSITSNVNLPVTPGTPITWTVSAGGSAETLEYQFWLYNLGTKQWQVLQAYGPTNQAVWTPSQAGTYSLQVWVRGTGVTAAYEAWRNTDPLTITDNQVQVTSFHTSETFPVAPGTSVTWSATATGGTGPLQYEFWELNQDTGVWSVLQAYSAASQVTWTPDAVGNYTFQVWVKSQGSPAAFEAWQGTPSVRVSGASVSVTGLTASSAFPLTAGTPVQWTATATGGTLEYQFWVYDVASGTWTVPQSYGASNTLTWTPPAPGSYSLQVWVREAGSKTAFDAWKGSGVFSVVSATPR